MEELCKELRSDRNVFEVQDFGVGSKSLTQERSVAQMLKESSSKGLYGDVLWRLMRHFQPKTILELGTNIGIGTLHLSQLADSLVYTVEGCELTQRAAIRTLSHSGSSNVVSFHDTFDEFLNRLGLPVFDAIFLDGHHNGEAMLNYLRQLGKLSHENTLFILDDIRWSDDMWKMWNTVCNDEQYHVTVDLGRMGLAWKRPDQVKEHFILRPRTFRTKLL